MAFPANQLELSDIGARLRLPLRSGAYLEDTLTGLQVEREGDESLKIIAKTETFGHQVVFTLSPESLVEYLDQ